MKIKKVNGFTLVELLLYVSITGFMLLVISLFLTMLLQARVKNQTVIDVEQQGLVVMQTISQSVRNAEVVNNPTVGLTDASLSINTVTAGNNPTIFDLSGGAIRIKEGTGSTINLTNSHVTATSLQFRNLSRLDTPDIVKISFTLSFINPEGKNEYNYSKSFTTSVSLKTK